jgi:hypothetical protein
MVLSKIEKLDSAFNIVHSCCFLAEKLKKESGIVYLSSTIEMDEKALNNYVSDNNFAVNHLFVVAEAKFNLFNFCEEHEISFLLLQLEDDSRKTILRNLKECRNLRIPYVLFKDTFSMLKLNDVLVPVGFLVEEYEKAQFASAFGRFCGATIHLLIANDYGTKAADTAEKMKQLFDKFALHYLEEKAKSDSYKLDKEAVRIAEERCYGIVLISASREYGLDDVIFGPNEYRLVKKSSVPILLVNPRADLYTLCD